MYWYSGIIFLILLFSGCAKQPEIGKKYFPEEDKYIIQAIFDEEHNLSKAINDYKFLYNKTDKYIYLKKMVALNFGNKEYNKTIELSNQFEKQFPDKIAEVIKYKIFAYLKLKKPKIALKIGKELLKKKRDISTYKLVAYIYLEQKQYNKAILYLKSAYSISHDENILVEMGDIFFKYLKKPNEAISYYQTDIRLYGCREMICSRLAEIYRSLYDYDNLIAIYKRLYKNSYDNSYAEKIVYILVEQGKFKEAIQFIKKNRLNKKLLSAVYLTKFRESNSYKDAYKIYKLTNNNRYFFLYSILKFENSKKSILDIKNLIANLETLIKKEDNPLYLNYLGYILIDYDIDPKKGVEYVQKALEKEVGNKAFLDSLAWGYYKLHKCKKAYEIMKTLNLNDKEIQKHKKIIRRCYDNFRKNYSKNRRKSKKR